MILNESDPGCPSGCRRLVASHHYSRRSWRQCEWGASQGRETAFLLISTNPGWFQNTSVPHNISLLLLLFLQTLFCSIGLVASSQTFEFSYFCWLLVGGHDDLTNGPHKSATRKSCIPLPILSLCAPKTQLTPLGCSGHCGVFYHPSPMFLTSYFSIKVDFHFL